MSKKEIHTEKSQALWNEAKEIIPGGCQLLSKRPEMSLPGLWPAYFSKAKGVEVTDIDDNTYLDMTHMSVGTCTLGYADPDVNDAVKKAIDCGTMSTLNAPEEVELAKLLLQLHPWAGSVRYARTGGESMAIAVRIARAHAKKEVVAFCGYHGWHDWYLATNLGGIDSLKGQHLSGLSPTGIPPGLSGTVLPFQYNDIEQLQKLLEENEVGVIVMEPMRHQEPKDDFLHKVRTLANKYNCILIFDEISIGFRLNIGGSHLVFGVEPDIAVFGKAMSNGFPMAAIIGTKEVMSSAEGSFISSTYWTEKVGFVAALTTIHKMIENDTPSHLQAIGTRIAHGWKEVADKHSLNITITGPMSLVSFAFNYDSAQILKTLFVQEMLKRGILAGTSVYVSQAHTEKHVDQYLSAVDEVFTIIQQAIVNNNAESLLEGPVAHKGFARLT